MKEAEKTEKDLVKKFGKSISDLMSIKNGYDMQKPLSFCDQQFDIEESIGKAADCYAKSSKIKGELKPNYCINKANRDYLKA